MPSKKPLPTVSTLLSAGKSALVGERDRYGDQHDGALYEHVIGPTAILLERMADRDQDAFRAIYWDDADGDDLTRLIQGRTGIARILDTYGTGIATFRRPTAAAGAGKILAGSRIPAPGSSSAVYVVASDTPVGASQLEVAVPIRATVYGAGTAIAATNGLSLLDPCFDSSLVPTAMVCGDGTSFEQADAYRDRARAQRIDQRNGYASKIVQVCQATGATYVLLFASDYGLAAGVDPDDPSTAAAWADDYGLNAIYVADANYQSPASLVRACTIALESCRVLGADLWVGGITQASLQVQATLHLVDDPGLLQTIPIQRAAVQALLAYFGATSSGYLYQTASLESTCQGAHPAIQAADVTVLIGGVAQGSDPTLSPSAWPATLTRYSLASRDIVLTLTGPV